MITKKTPLKKILEIGRECRRCGHCCRYGSGALASDDIKNISKYLDITEQKLKSDYLEEIEKFNTRLFRPKLIRKGKPYGQCIFFDEGCSINKVKPTECRTGNCGKHGEELSKWFMLNYFVNEKDPESIRQYSIYLKTQKPIKGGELENMIPKDRLKKILKFEI